LGLATVHGRSMLPTLSAGDRLLVRYDVVPRPGDLVLVRLAADGGTAARPLAVKRVAHRERTGWWVERDNPAEGVDSWVVGAVPDHDVVATVVALVWPPRRMRLRLAVRD
jgi:signal peptidase I